MNYDRDEWLYNQLRQVYRDLEQDRAIIFYDMKRKEKEMQELKQELSRTDISLNEYQAKIKEMEEERC